MTIAVDMGRKATKTNKQTNASVEDYFPYADSVNPDQTAPRGAV